MTYYDHAGSISYLLSYPPPPPVRLPSVDSETHGRTSYPGLTTTAVSVLPSRYIRMYTVYQVHIHMSEGLWFFNKKQIKNKCGEGTPHQVGIAIFCGAQSSTIKSAANAHSIFAKSAGLYTLTPCTVTPTVRICISHRRTKSALLRKTMSTFLGC